MYVYQYYGTNNNNISSADIAAKTWSEVRYNVETQNDKR